MTGLRPAVAVELGVNTERHLERNLALTAPTDTARGMFFNGALDAVGRLAGQELARSCRQITGERKHMDFFNYPVSSFLNLCLGLAQQVGPQLGGCEKMLRWLGEQSARDFLSSMAGRTAMLLAGGNVKRLLSQLPSSYRAAVSYGERSVTWRSDKQGLFLMKNDFMPPAYHEGILIGTLQVAQARGAQVVGHSTGPLDSEYALSWE